MREYKKKYRKKKVPPGTCSNFPDCANEAAEGKKRCPRCSSTQAALEKKPSSRARKNKRNAEIRAEVVTHYGGKCLCCGEEEFEFLTIDRIEIYDGTGPRSGTALYRWLKRNGFPDGFRVLCQGCNFVLGHRGHCPHSDLTQKHNAGRPVLDERRAERLRATKRERHLRLKKAVLSHYGPLKCACCGEPHIELLTLDHMNGDGAAHRKKHPKAKNLYIWLRQNDYPPGYEILCFNCNYSSSRDEQHRCVHRRVRLPVA